MTEMQYITLMDPHFAAVELIDVGAAVIRYRGTTDAVRHHRHGGPYRPPDLHGRYLCQ
jgi:hypothetical protein